MGVVSERELYGGTVDMITGSPLLRAVDLELKFGGATYRHVRSYAEPMNELAHEREQELFGLGITRYPEGRDAGYGDELFWDWHGQGWMMGENPLFLFEASYRGIGQIPAQGTAAALQDRICYFVPDAHHSIPFVREIQDGQPVYIAPPQFDAMMTVSGGEWNSTSNSWMRMPTSVDVWLYNRAVHYHIELQVVPGAQGESDTTLDVAPGAFAQSGIPAWGLTTMISDRWGNRVELEYAPVTMETAWSEDGCSTCRQSGASRGQLRIARLYPATTTAGQDPEWTLVFTHRTFTELPAWAYRRTNTTGLGPAMLQAMLAAGKSEGRQRAVHSIHAYKGMVQVPASVSLTIPSVDFWRYDPGAGEGAGRIRAWTTSGRDQNNVELFDPVGRFGLPANWVHELRYVYSEPGIAPAWWLQQSGCQWWAHLPADIQTFSLATYGGVFSS
jgi:hypothetical protein